MLKAYFMYIFIGVAMVVVIARVIAIQYGDVAPTPHLSEADTNGVDGEMPTRIDSIQPLRGRILSDNGSDLVTSIPIYNLHMDLTVVKDELFEEEVDSLAFYLAQVFDKRNKSEWEQALRTARADESQYYPIQNKVQYDVLQKVRAFPIFREGKYKGGFIEEKESIRQKPYGLLARRTLGSKRIGAMNVGLEGAFDQYLTGEYGLVTKQYVSNGWKPVSGDYLKEPVPGADVITSIDIDVQDVAENELKKQLEEQQALYGSVVLMEVETGFVKAIANLKRAGDGEYYEIYNYAVGQKTDPGSTFKLATLMALLEDGKVAITDSVNAVGKYDFYDQSFVDTNPWGYGKITIQHAFEVSSNVFSKIANKAYYSDEQKFVDRLKSFGLGDTLGLDIAGEAIPVLKNVGEDGWSGITLPWMAIGYEVEITPIQTLAFYNAVANNGELVKPQFVSEIRRDGEVIEKFEKVVLNEQICSDETIISLKKCLEGVIERGTGKNLKSTNFKIAGKTGTARLADGAEGYSNFYQASFAGYFPADNPKYSCIVVIAGPTKQIYGAQVSGTVFASIANKVYSSSLEYHPDYNGKPMAQSLPRVKAGRANETIKVLNKVGIAYEGAVQQSGYLSAEKSNNKIRLKDRIHDKGKVPFVVGMPLNDAVMALESVGLRVKVQGSGKVKSQSIQANSKVVTGQTVKIVLN
ncbi:penicillin-binding protein [Crocinitomix algicola]|uniref:penicillin-binding protein n=1 Tax=Crocinitomix algicola TaxID=1740263 RepID=UPI0015866125|nr:penicillin-binding protein [Crocinitomix algicola]